MSKGAKIGDSRGYFFLFFSFSSVGTYLKWMARVGWNELIRKKGMVGRVRSLPKLSLLLSLSKRLGKWLY